MLKSDIRGQALPGAEHALVRLSFTARFLPIPYFLFKGGLVDP
jgi:hypothetical protein